MPGIVHEKTIAAKRRTALNFISLILGGLGLSQTAEAGVSCFSGQRTIDDKLSEAKENLSPGECPKKP